jgi:hypothetical protein
MINDLKIMETYINDNFNFNLDITKLDVVKNLLINGINLPKLDDNASINSFIFNIASAFISSTRRFNSTVEK